MEKRLRLLISRSKPSAYFPSTRKRWTARAPHRVTSSGTKRTDNSCEEAAASELEPWGGGGPAWAAT